MMWRSNDMCSDTSSSSDSDVPPGFFPIYCDFRGTMTDRKVYQAYKGQLKLSVYINYGLLTVHVMQARNLQCQTRGLCNTYIKLCLSPDTTNRTCCMTEVVLDSNNPLFDEKFSFELLEEDVSKRLLISVWNRDRDVSEDEFLGAMSFGIQHIQQHGQIVAGWYYLLMGEIGTKKHLRVPERKLPSSDGSIPLVNTAIKWMEPHTFVLKRKRGFGFSLCGSCPVSVSKVEPGSMAAIVGLCKGDCIVKIDGINVSRSTADSIARIFRHADKQVVLEVHRPQHQGAPPDSAPVSWRPPLSDKEPNCQPQKIEKLNVSPWKPPNIRSPMADADDTMRNYGWLESTDRSRVQSNGQRVASTHGQQGRTLSGHCQQTRTHTGLCQQFRQQTAPVTYRSQQSRIVSTHCQQNALPDTRQHQHELHRGECQQYANIGHREPFSIPCQQNELVHTYRQQTELFDAQCQQNERLGSRRQHADVFDMDCEQDELVVTECGVRRKPRQQTDGCLPPLWERTRSLGRTKSMSRNGRTLQGVSDHMDVATRKPWYSHGNGNGNGKENNPISALPVDSMQARKVSFKDFF